MLNEEKTTEQNLYIKSFFFCNVQGFIQLLVDLQQMKRYASMYKSLC